MNTLALIVMFVEPSVVQFTPSVECDAVKVLPVRTMRTQRGAVTPGRPVDCELAPVVVRRWKAKPFVAERIIIACGEPALRLSRIMTPALAHGFVGSTAVTRARISQSP